MSIWMGIPIIEWLMHMFMAVSHLRRPEGLKCICTLGQQSGFLLHSIKADTRKLYEHICIARLWCARL